MAWSWIGLLLGFVFPLLAYIASNFIVRRYDFPHKKKLPALIAIAAALCSSATVILLIFSSPYWRDGTRIVWTGMQSHNEPLLIGGKPEETAIGWPNGAPFPKLKVTPRQGSALAALEISGGGAFIFDEEKKRFLNGKPVAVGSTERFGDYQIRVNRLGVSLKFWRWFSSELEILDAGGQKLAGFALRAEDRTRPLGYMLAGTIVEPLTRLEKIADREKLEDWASGIWLIRKDSEKVYVLTSGDSETSESELPANLTVKWANLTLPVSISSSSNNTTLDFVPPWRLSSPLPPRSIEGCPESEKANNGNLNLVVTGRPSPCEIALVLPVGRLAGNLQQAVTIDAASQKFNSPGAIDSAAAINCPPGVKCEVRRVGTSEVNVQGNGAFTFYLTTVHDLPSRKGIFFLIFLAFILFAAGIVLAYPRMPETNRWVIYGIVTSVWLFLSFRLLLAFRYALDPVSLDKLSVNGVTRSFFGLMIVPGLLLLWTRLRCDRDERLAEEDLSRRAMRFALYYLLALFSAALFAQYFPSRLWSGLPRSYHFSIGDLASLSGLGFIGLLALVALLLALHIRFLYRPDSKGLLVKVFVKPWYLAETHAARSKGFWAKHLNKTPGQMVKYFLSGLFVLVVFSVLFWLLTRVVRVLPGDKTAQELVVPLIFYWIAILWIGLKLHLQSNKGVPWSRRQTFWLIVSAILMISFPAIAIPIAIMDFGSVLSVLAILLPLIAVLLVGRSLKTGLIFIGSALVLFLAGLFLPWLALLGLLIAGLLFGVLRAKSSLKAGLAVAFGVVLLFGLGGLFYQNLEGMILPNAKYIPFVGGQGRVFARLLNYKKGSLAQQYAILANSVAGGEGLPYQELLNGNQHTWENKAIAHEGGWLGLGFGAAPVQRSQVRRDTLQYDSVFSFFIVSEYGWIGSLLLLLMCACPLFIIFVGGRDRLDAGYALALIVAGAFLIESLYHAGMNLGAFPMSGRNLPLLSVNSPSDLLRWTLLWGFALQTIFWRYEGRRIKDEATSLTAAASSDEPKREPLVAYAPAIWIIPALTALAVLINGWGVLREEKEFEKFNYDIILNNVKWYLANGVIDFDQVKRKLDLKEERLTDPDAEDFIQQEVERFNARTERERLEELREQREQEFEDKLTKVNSVQEYQRLIKETSEWRQPELRRSIFRLLPVHNESGRIETYKVTTNSDFNVSYSFKVGLTANDLPRVTYGDELLLGPAWTAGHFETAIDPRAPLPWVSYMRDALEVEWLRLKKERSKAAIEQYGTLTLNKSLHESALKFISAKGMEAHASSLRRYQGSNDYKDKLPPRVALSVISLPEGRTLALSGWPRMTSARDDWELERVVVGGETQGYWLPSARWLEREASQSISTRYRGDRNFDRSLVMGSSTKPLWAAAVLKVHPKVADFLQVAVAGGEESDVFGLRIEGKPWDLNGRGGDWVGFRTYLKQSDNRYHIRLGFLGLAEKDGAGIKASGASPSRNESLSRDKRPWGRYPQFLPSIKVDESNQRVMLTLGPDSRQSNTGLASSELAEALRGMFSIGVKGVQTPTGEIREISFRRSFWTRNENDDLNVPVSPSTGLLNQIAPEAPDFAFDRLYKPRDYVTMLLGSGTNLWANVDLAAAFGSCITGKPVVAHIVRGTGDVQTLEGRKLLDPEIALQLRPGLKDVVDSSEGTAFRALAPSKALGKLRGFSFYAKTGTLKTEEDQLATSRIILAVVKWKNEKKGEVAAGLVFSIFVEQGGTGTAASWLNEFIVANEDLIATLLKEQQ